MNELAIFLAAAAFGILTLVWALGVVLDWLARVLDDLIEH